MNLDDLAYELEFEKLDHQLKSEQPRRQTIIGRLPTFKKRKTSKRKIFHQTPRVQTYDWEDFKHKVSINKQQFEEIVEVFRDYDTNGDGYISRPEFYKMLRSIGQNPKEKELDKLFDQLDTNNNNKIEFDELIHLVEKVMSSKQEDDDTKSLMKFLYTIFDKGVGMVPYRSKIYQKKVTTNRVRGLDISEVVELIEIVKNVDLHDEQMSKIKTANDKLRKQKGPKSADEIFSSAEEEATENTGCLPCCSKNTDTGGPLEDSHLNPASANWGAETNLSKDKFKKRMSFSKIKNKQLKQTLEHAKNNMSRKQSVSCFSDPEDAALFEEFKKEIWSMADMKSGYTNNTMVIN